jgi:photosystem II stability/assembly factor-like uncharacterized protein
MRTAAIRLLAAASFALVAVGASAAADSPASIATIVSGTAHQALFSIALDDKLGVAAGAGGELLESTDAGASWKAVTPGLTELSLLGVAVRQGRAVAVGQQGLVLVRPQGKAWNKAVSGTSNRLFAVRLNAKGQALAVGAFGTVLKSDDGGEHWQPAAPQWISIMEQGEEPHLYDADIDDDGVFTIVGEFGLILRSSDGGASWKTLHKGEASLFAFNIRPDGVGYAVGQSGAMLRSSDHGNTWEALKLDTTAILLGVCSGADGQVVVTGLHDMLISNDDGKSWRHINSPEITASWYQTVVRPQAAPSAFAVGHAGQIIRIGS